MDLVLKMMRRARWWLPAVVAAATVAVLWWRPWLPSTDAIEGSAVTSFPAVETAGLDPTRLAVLGQLRGQFQAPHPGAFYAEGTDEPWCADFVSWIMRAADQPLANPNSGSWRIPGVATLADYYQSTGRFRAADSGYQPAPGDVVLYTDASPFHQHTNIVVGYDAGTVTTVGGNERGAIRAHRFLLADDPGVAGFGLL